GVTPERLGVRPRDGGPAQTDGRAIWRLLAEHWHAFRGTPSRLWLELTFPDGFGLGEARPGPATAHEAYDAIAAPPAAPGRRPRGEAGGRGGAPAHGRRQHRVEDRAHHVRADPGVRRQAGQGRGPRPGRGDPLNPEEHRPSPVALLAPRRPGRPASSGPPGASP